MNPYISILNYEMPSYTLMALIGCAAAIAVTLVRCPKKGLRLDDSFFFIAFIIVGAFVGAKVLYALVNLPGALANREMVFSGWVNAIHYLFGGLVFYGGLIGGFVGAVCYVQFFHVNAVRTADNFIPAIPLFHALGRVGCFLAGCCYGIPYTGIFAVTFTKALSDANGVSRFPVQLLEAVINVGFFVTLLLYAGIRRKRGRYRLLQNFGLYLILYAVARFFLEYLRGDVERGALGPFSTSQWISLIICVPLGLYMLLCPIEKNVVTQRFLNGDLVNETPIPKQKPRREGA